MFRIARIIRLKRKQSFKIVAYWSSFVDSSVHTEISRVHYSYKLSICYWHWSATVPTLIFKQIFNVLHRFVICGAFGTGRRWFSPSTSWWWQCFHNFGIELFDSLIPGTVDETFCECVMWQTSACAARNIQTSLFLSWEFQYHDDTRPTQPADALSIAAISTEPAWMQPVLFQTRRSNARWVPGSPNFHHLSHNLLPLFIKAVAGQSRRTYRPTDLTIVRLRYFVCCIV